MYCSQRIGLTQENQFPCLLFGELNMKIISITPFFAVAILGIAVFSAHPSLGQKNDFSEWKSNQQILLLIENCQAGQVSIEECKSRAANILEVCKTTHVLVCDDHRLLNLLDGKQVKIETSRF